MPLEQEVPFLLSIGFISMILVFAVSTIILWNRSKRNSLAYFMILLHLFFLSIGFYFFINALTPKFDYNHPMASEENSPIIVIAGGFWALSMISLLVSIFNFSSKPRKDGYLN